MSAGTLAYNEANRHSL